MDEKNVVVITVSGDLGGVPDDEMERLWRERLEQIPGVRAIIKTLPDYLSGADYDRVVDEDADAVLNGWVTSDVLTSEFFDHHPRLTYFSSGAHGYEAMDFSETRERHITVTNTPYGANAIAEYAFALILEIYHHISARDRFLRTTDWTSPDAPPYMSGPIPQFDLAGKTFGILGLGKIGRAAARIAHGFGMRVIAHIHHPRPVDEGIELVSLDELLKQSDVISLHASANPSTFHIIDERALDTMKTGAVLINTARGSLIDEEALARALKSGKLLGAGLDVLTDEPPHPDNPLLSCDNAVLTNHVAWLTPSCQLHKIDVSADTYRAYLEGHPINVVNNR